MSDWSTIKQNKFLIRKYKVLTLEKNLKGNIFDFQRRRGVYTIFFFFLNTAFLTTIPVNVSFIDH